MQEISIRFLARRTGIAASALRYYETHDLLKTQRNCAGQRRYPRSDIRRVSIVIIAQKCGFRLRDIKKLLAPLSQNRSPTAAEWALVSQAMRAEGFQVFQDPQFWGLGSPVHHAHFPPVQVQWRPYFSLDAFSHIGESN